MSREEDWKRISAMAGLDEDGGILPETGGGIDRRPVKWRWVSYGGTVTEHPDGSGSVELWRRESE